MKHYGWLIATGLLFLGCTKDSIPEYPDCFAEIPETHNASTSYGGAVVVSLSDTTALSIYVDYKGMNLRGGCKTFDVGELNTNSHIEFCEWRLHPDSIPPDLTSDVLYPNTSSYRFWSITSGTITTSVLTPEEGPYQWGQISLQLSNAQFDRSQSSLPTVTINNLVVKDVATL